MKPIKTPRPLTEEEHRKSIKDFFEYLGLTEAKAKRILAKGHSGSCSLVKQAAARAKAK